MRVAGRAEVVGNGTWLVNYLHVTSRIVGVFVGTTPSKSPAILSPINHAQKIAVAAGQNCTHSASRAWQEEEAKGVRRQFWER